MKKYKRILSILICVIIMIQTIVIAFSAPSELQNNHLYYIKNKGSGKYLNVTSTSNVVQYSLTREPNQKFFIRLADTVGSVKYYSITPDSDNSKRVEVQNAQNANFANIRIFQENPSYSSAQMFRFILCSNTSYQIMPRLSTSRVLDVTDASNANNANIQLYDRRTDNSDIYKKYQEWYLVRVSKSLNNFDLVDSGKHLDYNVENSSFAGETHAAMLLWNSYKEGVVRKDTILTAIDVRIEDATNLGATTAALTSPSGYIKVNTSVVNNFSNDKKINCLIHEMGHALGMGHIDNTNNVMYYAVTNVTVLRDSNRNSYDLAYERY